MRRGGGLPSGCLQPSFASPAWDLNGCKQALSSGYMSPLPKSQALRVWLHSWDNNNMVTLLSGQFPSLLLCSRFPRISHLGAPFTNQDPTGPGAVPRAPCPKELAGQVSVLSRPCLLLICHPVFLLPCSPSAPPLLTGFPHQSRKGNLQAFKS